MYSLIRFFNEKDHVKQFLEGDIYMNSIGHFWKIGIEPQNDFTEGTVEVMAPEELKKQHDLDIRSAFGDHILLPVMSRLETYKFVHILCFMMHEYDQEHREVLRVNSWMKNMGKYAVRIMNVQEFVDRLYDKLRSNKQFGLMGPLSYHSPHVKSCYRDCFDKTTRNAREKEWRFALIPDYDKAKILAEQDVDGTYVYDEHISYPIGNLRDIAEEIDVDILLKNPGNLYKDDGRAYKVVDKMTVPAEDRKKQLERIHEALGLPISYQAYPWQYVGWSSREGFREKVIDLGGGIKPLITIG